MGFWLIVFMLQCSGEAAELRYMIYFDSKMENELEIRDEIFNVYESIVQGVDKEYRASLVLKNAEQFALEENYTVEAVQDTIKIVIGDGKGTLISGEFEWVMCGNTVKPRSWLKEVLGF